MIRTLVIAGALTLAAVPQASAWNDIFNSVWGHKSNDTGGIIPWSPENERNAFAIAEEQCRWHNKFPVATSIQPGARRLHRLPLRLGQAALHRPPL